MLLIVGGVVACSQRLVRHDLFPILGVQPVGHTRIPSGHDESDQTVRGRGREPVIEAGRPVREVDRLVPGAVVQLHIPRPRLPRIDLADHRLVGGETYEGMRVMQALHTLGDRGRLAERVERALRPQHLLVVPPIRNRLFDRAGRPLEHARRALRRQRQGRLVQRVESLDDEGRRLRRLPVEVVLAQVHGVDPLVRAQPVARLLVRRQQNLDLVARTDADVRSGDLADDDRAAGVHLAALDLQHEVLAGMQDAGQPVRTGAVDGCPAGVLIDVRSAPPHDEVVVPEQQRMPRIGGADRVIEPAAELVRQVSVALGPVAIRPREAGVQQHVTQRRHARAEIPPCAAVEQRSALPVGLFAACLRIAHRCPRSPER